MWNHKFSAEKTASEILPRGLEEESACLLARGEGEIYIYKKWNFFSEYVARGSYDNEYEIFIFGWCESNVVGGGRGRGSFLELYVCEVWRNEFLFIRFNFCIPVSTAKITGSIGGIWSCLKPWRTEQNVEQQLPGVGVVGAFETERDPRWELIVSRLSGEVICWAAIGIWDLSVG